MFRELSMIAVVGLSTKASGLPDVKYGLLVPCRTVIATLRQSQSQRLSFDYQSYAFSLLFGGGRLW